MKRRLVICHELRAHGSDENRVIQINYVSILVISMNTLLS